MQHIWLPGDNDIGGETEDVSAEKLKIFNETFVQPHYINIKFISFTKINRMVSEFTFNYDVHYRNKTSIVLSHMPLALVPSVFIEKVGILILIRYCIKIFNETFLFTRKYLHNLFVSGI